jgi:hypothetical protein
MGSSRSLFHSVNPKRLRGCAGERKLVAVCHAFGATARVKPARVPPRFYVIHLVLMLSPALFAAAVYFLIQSGNAAADVADQQSVVFQWVAAAMAVIAVGFSQLLPRFMLRDEKYVSLGKYFTMKIVQWAMLEGASLFILGIFFMSHHMNLLIPIGVLIALIALLRPTDEELERYHVKAEE